MFDDPCIMLDDSRTMRHLQSLWINRDKPYVLHGAQIVLSYEGGCVRRVDVDSLPMTIDIDAFMSTYVPLP